MATPPASSGGGGGVDRLSSLPDEMLAQILSFLPAQVAVRTCVLARSWRGVWKLTRRLRITGTAEQESVDHLLGLRLREIERAPLDACEITFRDYDDNDEDHVRRWISRAVECKVQALRIDMYRGESNYFSARGLWLWLGNRPLISSHLARLVLCGVGISESFMDFSSCHVLEDLEITKCNLWYVRRIRSPSIKRLSITECHTVRHLRTCISVPRLVSLRLDCPSNRKNPVLERMPELVEAYVRIQSQGDTCYCHDLMDCSHITGAGSSSDFVDEGSSDDGASENAEDSKECVLLGGLSEAVNLALLCTRECYIFRRDLRWCPTFWKLKTLVLDDYWCEPADCRAMASILEHAPVLENLTVLFRLRFQDKYNVEVEGCLDGTKKPTLISQHLKVVKVKCEAVDGRVLNVLNFLGTVDIRLSFNEEGLM